jgi:hypothetical protein
VVPIRREYPATPAASIAVRRRTKAFLADQVNYVESTSKSAPALAASARLSQVAGDGGPVSGGSNSGGRLFGHLPKPLLDDLVGAARIDGGTVRLSALAVFWLMTSRNYVGGGVKLNNHAGKSDQVDVRIP